MSHFTVAVFTRNADADIDQLLAPYDENIQVAPYVSKTKEDIIRQAREEMQWSYENRYMEWKKDPMSYESNSNPQHISYLKSLSELMKRTDEELYQEKIQLYEPEEITAEGGVLSTYNPNSKWDWYQIGGRWQGMLILKNSGVGTRGSAGLMTPMTEDFDAAYVSDIDFEAMRNQRLEELQPYEKAMKSGFYKEEYMRKLFPSEEEYITRKTAFSTYAVVTPDGVWHAPGEMGWWGMSSDTVDQKRDWELNFHDSFIKPAIENGWYITIVDCHI